ncbi:MAG: hypothetical protein ACI8UZ_003161, partial [Akkermansiaceae bacterium]
MDAHILRDMFSRGEFGHPKAPGNIATRFRNAVETDPDIEGPESITKKVENNSGCEDEIDEATEDIKVHAIKKASPNKDEDEEAGFGNDGRDDAHMALAKIKTIVLVGDVFYEEGEGKEVTESENHPGNKELSKSIILADVAEGIEEFHS